MANLSSFGVPISGNDQQIMMPKLQYRFRVIMSGFGLGGSPREFTQNVVSVTRPSLTHDEVTIDAYNSRAFLAAKHTWEPITITLRDDMNNTVSKVVAEQLQKQLSHGTQSAPAAGLNYKFGILVEQLNGSDTPTVIESWSLAGCFLQNANYNENNYATSDVMQITLQVRYDNADVHSEQQSSAFDPGALTVGGTLAIGGNLNVTGNGGGTLI
jgi:hypothetical protein